MKHQCILQVGTGIDAYRTQTRKLAPSINDGWETGVKFSPLPWLDGRVSILAEQLVRAWNWRQLLYPLRPAGRFDLFGTIMAGYLLAERGKPR
ncbi:MULTISPECIES: hypothetical protein [Burkholderiales]|jgi:hypothetical protein|uniref:Uncharacterized protein n=2 Tax=Burkholderiales TaxID=80840 RepID=A0AA42L8L5_9BURK|nr:MULTISPECIES: hypothetical protein [Burkholderiales]MDH0364711.1 hypothetical protein [Comamonas aquatica]VVE14675.1 hypothetical protein PCE31107_02827 [Pandoraea cepalis]